MSELPQQVLTEIESSIRATRLRGVGELARLVHGDDLGLAAAARGALQRLTDDDSRSVAAAATAALERTAMRVSPDRVDFGAVPQETRHLIAEVRVDGPPLALATATLTTSGPGLRAAMRGNRLRIAWQPRSDWLDGTVTVHGPGGWTEVRVTGRVIRADDNRAPVEEWAAADGFLDPRAARVTVLPPRPGKPRRRGLVVLVSGLAALLLLGGGGAAIALTADRWRDPPPPVAQHAPAPRTLAGPVGEPVEQHVHEPGDEVRASVAEPVVLGRIRVGNEPEGVAVSPDSRTVYVANQGARDLSIVDVASREVTTVRLRGIPRFVTVARDGRLVFVSMYGNDKARSGSGVAVVDAQRRKVVRYLSTGAWPYTLAVGPDDRLWVPIHSSGRLEIFDAEQHVDGRIKVPPNPHAVAFSARYNRAYTANHESNSVAIIDMGSGKLIKSVPVSRSPHSVDVSPDGRRVLVAGYEADTADLIDARTLRRAGPFPVGTDPQSVAFARDGRHAYVVNEGDDTVTVLNGSSGKTTATVAVGGSPRTIAVAPDGGLAYVTNGHDDTISVIRVAASENRWAR